MNNDKLSKLQNQVRIGGKGKLNKQGFITWIISHTLFSRYSSS